MSAFENAKKFVEACDANKGWEACKEWVADDAPVVVQSEVMADIKSVQAYCDWVMTLDQGPLKGNSTTLHSSAWDEERQIAVFVKTYHAKHTGEGGPVEATGKETNSDYVYSLTMNGEGQVTKMHKVWNSPFCLKELGWA